jgi:hypothetical protein
MKILNVEKHSYKYSNLMDMCLLGEVMMTLLLVELEMPFNSSMKEKN